MIVRSKSALSRDARSDQLVLFLNESGKDDIHLVGGKGASLGEMLGAGFPVPPAFAVTTTAYREFMRNNRLYEALDGLLAQVDINDPLALDRIAKQVREAIMSAELSSELRQAIKEGYERLGQGPVAVRSSATAEDLPSASFAGQHSSFLNVEGTKDVIDGVQACWASLFEARAIYYRKTHGFSHDDVAIAVPIQRMIDAEVSGVLFTANPTTGDRDVLMIEAVYGLGESLVSGKLSPDSYLIDKPTLKILRKDIVPQASLLHAAANGKGFESGTINSTVPAARQGLQKLRTEEIIALTQLALRIEEHYGRPQDVEWAMAEGQLYILQARPITTLHRPSEPHAEDIGDLEPVLTGYGASPGVGAGRVRIIAGSSRIGAVEQGSVLVTEMTTPDFVPVMKRSAAIVTDRGGRTCHAAIVSREMGIPCVVGAGNATIVLRDYTVVTVDGKTGKVYAGDLADSLATTREQDQQAVKLATRTKLYVNLADPDAAERAASIDVDGVGLLRAEFIMAHIGEHPRAMLEAGRGPEFTRRLSEGLETFARAFHPRPVVFRLSDFKTSEYRNLRGGEPYEPLEENPMLGYRGCARYLQEPDLLALETEAVRRVRERFPNLWVMLPFVRTVEELHGVKKLLEKDGLRRNHDMKLWMMVEVPSNVLLLDEFLEEGVDGVSIGSNDLTQLVLGVDRDNERLASLFDERDSAVLRAIERVISGCTSRGVTVSICGQAPSVFPELTRKLVSWGITSISVSADVIQETRRIIHDAETSGPGPGG